MVASCRATRGASGAEKQVQKRVARSTEGAERKTREKKKHEPICRETRENERERAAHEAPAFHDHQYNPASDRIRSPTTTRKNGY